ncbi:MAG TPA: 2-hydroxyacyl-CoA dehydratase family protein [Syntrophorhabdaceae bacterium]|nr:2-hydroxyacyl-CoA dehydratase family protein [Syntrophorhabdaceae bacterium]
MGPLDEIKQLYEHRDLAARDWKSKGGKVVGYISDDVPEELILSAGFFPFRMSGDPYESTAEADKYCEYFLDPSVRSILSMLLMGKYNFLDYMIIPHHSDAVLKLYHELWWIHKINPLIVFPQIHLFDVLHTTFLNSAYYVRRQLADLKTCLEQWSGKMIDLDALSRSIQVVNNNRSLLKRISDLRKRDDIRISGVEALQITGTSCFMMKEDHSKLLTNILNGAETLPVKTGVRVFIEGSDLDNTQFYDLIESSGAVIVGEDSNWGDRYSEDPVDENAEPMEALAERYHIRPSRLRTQSSEQRVKYCSTKTNQAKAQGVIFYLLEWDPAVAWDQPDQKKDLAEKGIPSICFSDQKYLLSESGRTAIQQAVETFLNSIRKGPKEDIG